MSVIEKALELCRETEADPALCAGLSDRLESLGFEHTWAFPNGDETIWTHPSVKAHNDGTGAAILSSYFCDLRRTGDELWFSVGRVGNSVNYRMTLPPEEHKKCPQCGGEVFYGYLRFEERLVFAKPGAKRRTRKRFEVSGWRCVGHYTDPVTRECGWTEEVKS